MSLITIKLYGHLGRKFGKIHRFDVATPAEAIRALKANFKEFAGYLMQHSEQGYRIITDMGERTAEQLNDPMGGKSIKIVPVVAGAGNGIGQFIMGAVLVAADTFLLHTGYISQIGVAMMVGGAAQMLFAPPAHQPNNGKSGDTPSYAFGGPVNTTVQGNPVPICYGRLRVGSQVISGGLYAANIPL